MIPRYSDPFMTQLWSEENKYQAWFRVELEVVQAYENAGEVASGTAGAISEASKNIDWSRFLHEVNEKEKITKHDVIAVITQDIFT